MMMSIHVRTVDLLYKLVDLRMFDMALKKCIRMFNCKNK